MASSHGAESSSAPSSDEDFSDESPKHGQKRGARGGAAASSSHPPGQQVQMKACSKCKEVKPAATSFWKDPTKSSGYTSWCKACFNQQAEKRKAEGPVVVTERECSICKQRKPADAFMKDSRRITGLDARCRECRRAQHAARKQRNIEAGNKMWDEKECKRCHMVKPAAMFKRHAYTASGLDSWCKECCRERRKELLAQKAAQQQAGAGAAPAAKECVACNVVKPATDFARDRGQASGLSRRCKACEKEYRRSKRQCITPSSLTPTTLSPCPSPPPGSPIAAAMLMQGGPATLFNQQQQQQQPGFLPHAPASVPSQLPSLDVHALLQNSQLFSSSLDSSGLAGFSSSPLAGTTQPLVSPAGSQPLASPSAAVVSGFGADGPFAVPQQQHMPPSFSGPSAAALGGPSAAAPGMGVQPKKQSAFAVAPVLPQGLLESMGRPSQSWGPVISSGVPHGFRSAGSGSSQEQQGRLSPAGSGLCPSPNQPAVMGPPGFSPTGASAAALQNAASAGNITHVLLQPPPPRQQQQQQQYPAALAQHAPGFGMGPASPHLHLQQQQLGAAACAECFHNFKRDATLNLQPEELKELKDLLGNSLPTNNLQPMAAPAAPVTSAAAAVAAAAVAQAATAAAAGMPTAAAVSAPAHSLLPTGAALAAALPPVPPLVNLHTANLSSGPSMGGMGAPSMGPSAPPAAGAGASGAALRGDSFAMLSAFKWDSLINQEMRLDSILGDSLAVPNPAQRIASLVGATIPPAGGAEPMQLEHTLAAASRDNSLVMLLQPPASRDPSLLVAGMQPASRDASLMMMIQQPASREVSLWGSSLDPALAAAQQAVGVVGSVGQAGAPAGAMGPMAADDKQAVATAAGTAAAATTAV